MAREYVKKDNMLSKEIRYKKTEKGMMITEYYGNDSYVVLPDEIEGEPVTILGDYAFSRNLSVEEIWMPLELKEVGRYAFYNCRELRLFLIGTAVPPICRDDAFTGINPYSVLKVPSGCADTYKRASEWNNFASITGLDE